jgi:hypothetical protein
MLSASISNIAGTIFRCEDAGLPFKTKDRPVDVRFARKHARIIHQIAGRKVIGAVGDNVEVAEEFQRILAAQPRIKLTNVQEWINRRQFFGSGIQLLAPNVGRRVNDLPLQVGVIHYIEIDQAERAYASGRKVQGQRRPQPARANTQHARRLQLLLPFHADLRHDQVARVAQDFILAQRCWNFGGDRCHKVLA